MLFGQGQGGIGPCCTIHPDHLHLAERLVGELNYRLRAN